MKVHATYTNYDYDFKGSTNEMEMEWVSRIQDAGTRLDFTYMPAPEHLFEFGYTSNFQWFQPGKAVGTGEFGQRGTDRTGITMSRRQGFVNVLYFSNEHKLFNERMELRYGLRLNRFDNVGPTTLYTVDEITTFLRKKEWT